MKKKIVLQDRPKLTLNRETLVQMEKAQLAPAVGGAVTEGSACFGSCAGCDTWRACGSVRC